MSQKITLPVDSDAPTVCMDATPGRQEHVSEADLVIQGAKNGEFAVSFESLEQLRSYHTELLKRHRVEGDSDVFQSEAKSSFAEAVRRASFMDCPEDRIEGQHLLDYWATIMYRADLEPPDSTLMAFDATQLPSLPDELCPYVGLDAFRESFHDRFFGRSKTVRKLISRLSEVRVMSVVGPSGSGKSSVVQAGLLPLLRSGGAPELARSSGWNYIGTMVPGSHPLENLLQTLLASEDRQMLPQKVELLRNKPEEIVHILENSFGAPIVLVVDQFEEAFTLCQDDKRA